ncbi:MAG: hypothetical protein J6A83_07230 [Clostridia bacterium]|nr:hypothetical protein [Clostridia bacterium]
MKKALSLFLAFVMVALMIPFSAFITSATGETGAATDGQSYWSWDFTKYSDDGTDGTINGSLPAGWGADTSSYTSDGNAGWRTMIDEKGVRLGGANVGLGLTSPSDAGFDLFGTTENYVITVDWNTDYKFSYLCFSVGGTALRTNWTYRWCYNAGPSGGKAFWNHDTGAYDTLGGYFRLHNAATNISPSPTNEAGEVLTQAQIIDTFEDAAIAGRDFSTSLEVVAGKLTNIYITADGQTITYPVTAKDVKGFTVSHTGWGTNNYMYVKSVSIQKGSYATTSFDYSQDFTTLAADNGTDGNINSSLPTGVVASNDTQSTWWTSITENGVMLGGAKQGLGLTPTSNIPASIVDGNTDHVVTVKWNSTYKFNQIRFGWSYDYTPSKVWAENQLAFNYSGGPDRGSDGNNSLGDTIASFTDTGDQQANFGTSMLATAADSTVSDNCTTTTNAAGTALDADGRYYMLQAPAMTGADFVTSFVIKDGKIDKIYLVAGGETIIYTLNSDFHVAGYFGVWLAGWGDNNTVNIKSIEIKTGSYVAPTESANIVHNYNIANAADIDAIPYDICEEDGYGTITLNNGVLWNETTVAEEISYNNMIKVDGDLYGNLGDYTVDFTLAGGSEARIFYLAFGLNDDRNSVSSNSASNNKPWGYNFVDGNAFKLRIRADQNWASDNCSIWAYDASANKYIQANSDNYQRLSTNLSNAIAAGNDISFRAVIENNYLVCVYVSAGGYTIKATPRYRIAAPAGDIGFLQQSNDKFGLKSVTIYDAPIYNATVSGAEMAAPAGKAVVKVAGEATVINASAFTVADYLADAVAVKDNGVAIATDATFTPTAGKVYSLMNVAEIAEYVKNQDITSDTSLRLASNPGIRYTSAFEDSLIMDLLNKTDAITRIEMGTLITVEDHKTAMGKDMTIENLEAYQAAKREATGNADYVAYLTVTGEVSNLYTESVFRGSVIGVQSFTKNYVAVGYVTIEFGDTATFTLYSDEATASVKTLAAAIVADAEAMATYSENEQAALNYLATYTEA